MRRGRALGRVLVLRLALALGLCLSLGLGWGRYVSSSSSHVQLLALVLIKSTARRLAQLPPLLPLPLAALCPSAAGHFLYLCFFLQLQGCGTPISIRSFAILCCHSFIFVHAAGLAVIYLIALAGNQATSRPGSIQRRGRRQELSRVQLS